jgi:hypothetical protein
VLGYQQQHPESILGEADGVLIAIRVYDLNALSKPYLSNKIVAFFA